MPGAEDTRLKDSSRGSQWFLTKLYIRITRECFLKNTWTASHHWRVWFSRSRLKPKNLLTENSFLAPNVEGKSKYSTPIHRTESFNKVCTQCDGGTKRVHSTSMKRGSKGEGLLKIKNTLVGAWKMREWLGGWGGKGVPSREKLGK